MERHTTLSEVVTAGADALRHDLYHCYPASVQSYDAGTETASVQVMTNDVRTDIDTGEAVSEPWPVIVGVPVAWPRFGGFVIKGSLAPHDPVLLVAFDLDPTAALAAGRTLKPVDPADVRRHGGGYWWALPTNLLKGHAQGPVTGALTIGVEGQDPVIVIDGASIQLGKSGGDHLALASKVDAITGLLKTLASALGVITITVPGGATAMQAAAMTAAANALSSGIASVKSTLVKAQ